jgi:PAS domain S-box-containing protein
MGDLVLLFDRTAQLQRWNHVMEETTGRSRETLLAASPETLFDNPEGVQAAVGNALETGRETFEATVRAADSVGISYEFVATRHTNADADAGPVQVVAVGREQGPDIDPDQYDVILDSLTDAVYAIEPDGTFVYVNERYCEMKGVSRAELVGTNVDDWVTEETVERAEEMRALLASGERTVASVDYEFLAADGDRFPAELRFGEVDQGDTNLGRVGTIRDVSERVERERTLQRQNDRLDEFASIVSHDLRNPLNVAEGRLELAREECDSDQLDSVDDALSRMRVLVDDILTLAREGDTQTTPTPVPLTELVTPCWRSVATPSATLVVETDAVVRADEQQLRRLLENLFRNCVEHGSTSSQPQAGNSVEHGSTGSQSQAGDSVEQGSTGSRAGPDTDGDASGRDDGTVTVTIGDLDDGFYLEDDGPGIPPDRRERVFEAGYSTNPDGTGFGLRIVKEIVDAHGWTISVVDGTEDHGGGARFEIRGVTTSSTDTATL